MVDTTQALILAAVAVGAGAVFVLIHVVLVRCCLPRLRQPHKKAPTVNPTFEPIGYTDPRPYASEREITSSSHQVFRDASKFTGTEDTGSIGWQSVDLHGSPHAPRVAETSFNNMYDRSSAGAVQARPPPSPDSFSPDEVHSVATTFANSEESKLNDKLLEIAAERRRQEVLAESKRLQERDRLKAEAEANAFVAARQRREAELRENEAKRIERERAEAARGRAEAKELAAKKQKMEADRQRRAAEAQKEREESEKYRAQREAEARVVAQAERDFDEKERRRKILEQMAAGGI